MIKIICSKLKSEKERGSKDNINRVEVTNNLPERNPKSIRIDCVRTSPYISLDVLELSVIRKFVLFLLLFPKALLSFHFVST